MVIQSIRLTTTLARMASDAQKFGFIDDSADVNEGNAGIGLPEAGAPVDGVSAEGLRRPTPGKAGFIDCGEGRWRNTVTQRHAC